MLSKYSLNSLKYMEVALSSSWTPSRCIPMYLNRVQDFPIQSLPPQSLVVVIEKICSPPVKGRIRKEACAKRYLLRDL